MCRYWTCALRPYARVRGHGNGVKWLIFCVLLQPVNDMLRNSSRNLLQFILSDLTNNFVWWFLQNSNRSRPQLSFKIHGQLCRQWIHFECFVLTSEPLVSAFGSNFSAAAFPKASRKAFGSMRMQHCDVEWEIADADYDVFIKFAALALPQMIKNRIVVVSVWTSNDIRAKTVFIFSLLHVRWLPSVSASVSSALKLLLGCVLIKGEPLLILFTRYIYVVSSGHYDSDDTR